MTPQPIDVVDFFCGCGGTSAGLRAAGLRVLAGLDLDEQAAQTYRHNFPEAAFVERDIRGVAPADLSAVIERREGARLLLSACAPCQPYTNFHRKSSSRSRAAERTLLLQLIPFIDHMEPEFILVENVPGLHRVPGASTFNRFVAQLRRRGYNLDWDVVDCRSYGVPQRRRRLVLLGSRLGPIGLPAPSHGTSSRPFRTVRDAISHFPPITHGQTHDSVPNHQASKLTPLNLQRIQATREGGSRMDWPEELRLDCHATHSGHSDVYGRLAWAGQAPVLTTKCTSLSNGRYGHPEQDRPISVREAAALQTFPDSFVFTGSIKSATRQVGNAVPVALAEAMGKAIVEHSKSFSEVPATLAGAV